MSDKNILFIFNLIIGIFLIVYTFYLRLIVVRLPKDLSFFNNELLIKYSLIIFVILSIIFCVLNLVMNIIILLNKKPRETIFTQLAVNVSNIINNALFETYSFLSNLIPNIAEKVSYLSQKFYSVFSKKPETFFLFLIYIIRFIIILTFLIDVFLFFRINYMYKALALLIVSLLIKILLYILKDYSSNLEYVESLLIINNEDVDEQTALPITSFSLKEEYKHLDLDYFVDQYILCSKISGYLDMYKRYSEFFNPYINIIIYSLYLIGWLYVIMHNIW